MVISGLRDWLAMINILHGGAPVSLGVLLYPRASETLLLDMVGGGQRE